MRWSVIAVVLLLSGRAARVAVDYREGADFSGYRTFALVGHEDPGLDHERVQDMVREGLAQEGLREAPAQEADLLVRHRFIDTTSQSGGPSVSWGLGGGSGGVGLGLGVSTPLGRTERTRRELVLQMVDQPERRVVWQAQSRRPLDADASPARRREWIRDTVTEMLERYPPANDEL